MELNFREMAEWMTERIYVYPYKRTSWAPPSTKPFANYLKQRSFAGIQEGHNNFLEIHFRARVLLKKAFILMFPLQGKVDKLLQVDNRATLPGTIQVRAALIPSGCGFRVFGFAINFGGKRDAIRRLQITVLQRHATPGRHTRSGFR